MKASFDEIQKTLRKLSPKQLAIVRGMVNDLCARAEDDRQERASPPPRAIASPPIHRAVKRKWTSDTGMFRDSEVVHVMNKGIPLLPENDQQLERIMGMGNGHALDLLDQHLDSIGQKHGVFDADPDLDDDGF